MGNIISDSDLKKLREQALEKAEGENNIFAAVVVDLVDDIIVRKALHVEEQQRSADRLRIAVEAVETYIPDPKARTNTLEAIAKVGVG